MYQVRFYGAWWCAFSTAIVTDIAIETLYKGSAILPHWDAIKVECLILKSILRGVHCCHSFLIVLTHSLVVVLTPFIIVITVQKV